MNKIPKSIDNAVHDMLSFDPLDYAEKLTGKSYKDDQETSDLGFLLHLANNSHKRKVLEDLGDTNFSTTASELLELLNKKGFEIVLEVPFKVVRYGKDVEDTFYVLYQKELGIILEFESYGGRSKNINSGQVYYCWRPKDVKRSFEYTSSGSFVKFDKENGNYVWQGYHDIREGLISNLNRLASAGEFLKDWVEPQRVYLIHYGDVEIELGLPEHGRSTQDEWSQVCTKVTNERRALLPDEIKNKIQIMVDRTPLGSTFRKESEK